MRTLALRSDAPSSCAPLCLCGAAGSCPRAAGRMHIPPVPLPANTKQWPCQLGRANDFKCLSTERNRLWTNCPFGPDNLSTLSAAAGAQGEPEPSGLGQNPEAKKAPVEPEPSDYIMKIREEKEVSGRAGVRKPAGKPALHDRRSKARILRPHFRRNGSLPKADRRSATCRCAR